jgi:hypothetical protein
LGVFRLAEQITLEKFKVLMGEFHDAIDVVATQCRVVHETLGGIAQDFRTVTDLWQSPAAHTFEPLRTEFQRSSDDLDDVLAGILHRMRVTYDNYLETERKAVQNLTAQGGDTGGGSQHNDGGSKHNNHDHQVRATRREAAEPLRPTTPAQPAVEALREARDACSRPTRPAWAGRQPRWDGRPDDRPHRCHLHGGRPGPPQHERG